jgi:hypothetical protein
MAWVMSILGSREELNECMSEWVSECVRELVW